jgi:hypothetical protein
MEHLIQSARKLYTFQLFMLTVLNYRCGKEMNQWHCVSVGYLKMNMTEMCESEL